MPVIHDLICDACGEVYIDVMSTSIGSECIHCKQGALEIYYGNWGKRNAAALDQESKVTVYKHPETGKVIYPGRNDAPMPERYQSAGYERVEMRSMREIDRFSKKHGVVNEAAHYNRGNAYDTERGRR